MRRAVLALLCAVLCTAALVVQTQARALVLSELLGPESSTLSSAPQSSISFGSKLGRGLARPVIVNPHETPDMADALDTLASVLGKEPKSASAAAADELLNQDDTDDEDSELSQDDLSLMGDDDCNNLPSELGKCNKDRQKQLKESQSGSSSSFSSSRFRMLRGSGSSSSSSSSSGRSRSESGDFESSASSIQQLQRKIQLAMKISKSIPQDVKLLEQLKAQQEKQVESKARKEALKVLEEHRRLIGEMTQHIVKLRAKLNELIAKRGQLETSDERLRRELVDLESSESSSSGSSSSSSGSGSGSGSSSSSGSSGSSSSGSSKGSSSGSSSSRSSGSSSSRGSSSGSGSGSSGSSSGSGSSKSRSSGSSSGSGSGSSSSRSSGSSSGSSRSSSSSSSSSGGSSSSGSSSKKL